MTDGPLVTYLCHVGLRLPDPEAAAAFYERVLGVGVTGREPAERTVRLSALPPNAAVVSHHEIVLYPGEPVSVDHVGFGVADDEALDQAAAVLRDAGEGVEGPHQFERVHGPSLRLHDPDGLLIELLVPRAPVPRPVSQAGYDLIRLGHITRKSADPGTLAAWYQRVLGFRLSDRMGDDFFWLRCNRDHHAIALVRGASAGTHHLALEAKSWEEMRRLGDYFLRQGVRIEFGPGRHGPGNNLFVYFRDPWGLRWEIFCEMARVDDEETYRPGYWDTAQRTVVVNRWGPMPPPSFME